MNYACFGTRRRLASPLWQQSTTDAPSSLIAAATTPKSSDADAWDSWDDAKDTPIIVNKDEAYDGDKPDWQTDLSASLRSDLSEEQEAALARSGDSSWSGNGVDWDLPRERAFLVGAALKSSQREGRIGYSILESLEELGRLADTAGLEVVGHTHQLLDDPNPRTYVGTGKVAEIAAAVERTSADIVIFDDELSPGQLRNLERALGGAVQLCDRTALILDIFSQRAATREGKLQVELAQAEYQLPRLTRMWSHLERQAGGASGRTKGMGEKQIEVDRRLLRDQAAKLRRSIEEVRTHRKAYRDRRAAAPIPVVALVGYTNAGKSTLLNILTNAGVLAEDQLFATLDPTTRRVVMPGGQEVLFSDTVGFIQKLPTQLVAAFRATLEEIRDASLLLHVVDASHPSAAAQVDAVNKVLKDLEVVNVPTLTVWNKVDACADPVAVEAVASQRDGTVCVSARTGRGIDSLLGQAAARLEEAMIPVQVLIPYSQGDLVDEIHRCGVVKGTEYTPEGTETMKSLALIALLFLVAVNAATNEADTSAEEDNAKSKTLEASGRSHGDYDYGDDYDYGECQEWGYKYRIGIGYDGGDPVVVKKTANYKTCGNKCIEEDECMSFNYNKTKKRCYMYSEKDGELPNSPNAVFVSGYKECRD